MRSLDREQHGVHVDDFLRTTNWRYLRTLAMSAWHKFNDYGRCHPRGMGLTMHCSSDENDLKHPTIARVPTPIREVAHVGSVCEASASGTFR
jgi:hypothetical protein